MEEVAKKGTVTPLASLFPPEDAEKAVRRVQETLAEEQAELDRVQGFISDNTSLISLVQRLPEDLHHDIMAKLFNYLPFSTIYFPLSEFIAVIFFELCP
jgi:unconventional prefoldin RPB5 interactor 1